MIDKERLEAHLNNGKVEYIMCAANWVNDGFDYYYQPYNIPSGIVFCGWRHACIFQQYRDRFPYEKYARIEVQGFLTTKNRFLTRAEALILVKENGQLKGDIIGGVLTSEDLW